MIDPAYLEQIGVFQDPADRQYKRHRIRSANFEYDPTDPQAERNGKLIAYEQQLVPHPVVLPVATDPASIEEARLKAVATGADFHHPGFGWLRWGRKREAERAENLGASTVQYARKRVTLAAAVDAEHEPEPEPAVPARGLKGQVTP